MTPFSLAHPWRRAGWGALAVILVISLVLGFIVVSRYQQNGEPLGVWASICRGLGIAPDLKPASAPQPPLRTATLVAWTGSTLDQIAAGNAKDGAFVALNCTACHGEGGVSTSDLIPTLAGMYPAVIYKQLADYRSGKRLWGVMNGIAEALSVKNSADVASYFAGRPGGLPAVIGLRVPEGGRSLQQSNPAIRLVFAGDPARGIAPCSACHGPGGYSGVAASAHHLYRKPAVGLRSRHAPERHQRADAHNREAIDTGGDACRRSFTVWRPLYERHRSEYLPVQRSRDRL
jgi:cytochrome c553